MASLLGEFLEKGGFLKVDYEISFPYIFQNILLLVSNGLDAMEQIFRYASPEIYFYSILVSLCVIYTINIFQNYYLICFRSIFTR